MMATVEEIPVTSKGADTLCPGGLRLTPWLWNTRHCWYNYPYQPLTADLHYYYILELSFYWSLMVSQFTDIKRKVRVMMSYGA
ncbi:hypothetical protein U0070_021851 [Myodes glareolus]|uniref:TLC domain-containing protein n=1 Tax=Myodes glareolus TaxID=447135 RepID=A0AAW0H7H7_MYOGA